MASRLRTIVAVTVAGMLFCSFAALGTWQLQRRIWKLALIDRVERRVHASATAAPALAEWRQISVQADEYRHVWATGRLLYDSETLVQAATRLGSGFWVMTPLQRVDGTVILVNRGFVPAEWHDPLLNAEPSTNQTISGLLRMSETRGAFLHDNVPAADQWYSRDVQAIAARRHLTHVAPYFIDAETPASASAAALARPILTIEDAQFPVGGLTVVSFYNNHLVYALTWFTLAGLCVVAIVIGTREERRAAAVR